MMPLQYAERIAYSSKETLKFTYDMAVKYAYAEGYFVECGIGAGAQIIAMAYAAPHQDIYAFDSYEGIPLPSNRDDQMPGIRFLSKYEQSKLPNPGEQILETTGATSVSLEDVKKHIIDSGVVTSNINFIKGWFEDTVKEFHGPIALLRLDGDLYNSTYVCLEHLFPNVIEAGIVIVDDWSLKGCQDACKEYFKAIDYKPDWKFISNIAYFYK